MTVAPTFIGAATNARSGTFVDAGALPAGAQEGDYALAIVAARPSNTTAVTPVDPAWGAPLIDQARQVAGHIVVYGRFLTANDNGSLRFDIAATGVQNLAVVVYRGVDPNDPLAGVPAGVNGTPSNTAQGAPALTTDVDNARYVGILHAALNSIAVQTWVWSSLTERADFGTNTLGAAPSAALTVGDIALGAAGAQTSRGATTTNSTYAGAAIALTPAPDEQHSGAASGSAGGSSSATGAKGAAGAITGTAGGSSSGAGVAAEAQPHTRPGHVDVAPAGSSAAAIAGHVDVDQAGHVDGWR